MRLHSLLAWAANNESGGILGGDGLGLHLATRGQAGGTGAGVNSWLSVGLRATRLCDSQGVCAASCPFSARNHSARSPCIGEQIRPKTCSVAVRLFDLASRNSAAGTAGICIRSTSNGLRAHQHTVSAWCMVDACAHGWGELGSLRSVGDSSRQADTSCFTLLDSASP